MILSFSITNFRSVKDTVTLSMLPVKGYRELQSNIVSDNKINVLRSAVMYGANASGKSNILKALTDCIDFIKNSSGNKLDSPVNVYDPFLLDADYIQKPSVFEIEFVIQHIRYVYYFSCNETSVIEERLMYSPKGQPVRLFERTDTTVFKYGTALKGEKKSIEQRLLNNQLFLSKAANEKLDILKDVYGYFNKIETDNIKIGNIPERLPLGTIIGSILKENDMYFKAFESIIKSLDVGIHALKIKKTTQGNPVLSLLPKGYEDLAGIFENMQLPRDLPKMEYELFAVHERSNSKTDKTDLIDFPVEKESAGTRNLLKLALDLLTSFKDGSVMIIDEFERSLHPHIVRKLIELFHDSGVNVNNAQLIFSTHAASLLDNELFRRDQIWLTEKDEHGATELYALSQVEGVRKDIPYDKWYLSGRFGATPIVAEPDIDYN